MKCLFTLITVLLFSSNLLAAEISGRVFDAESGRPLAGVNILLEGSGIGTFTDADGEFTLTGAPASPFVISAGHIGYKVQKKRLSQSSEEMLNFELEPVFLKGEDVIVTASRADLSTASAAFTNLTSEKIRETYQAQEMPLLLETIPGVFSYSDAGSGQGYSYLKIRGFDQKRIQVMINGIPLNDPEDHQVYWVDMPDLASNVADIQVQRGLGYSPYGPSAFGGSVNILTTPDAQNRKIEASYGLGSFNTKKGSVLFNSGLVENSYQVYGRFSRIVSDGYRDNSGFEGWSYYLSASRFWVNSSLTINLYGGPEFLHASWDGTEESILDTNRTYNPITYDNTVDNFNQPHYEIHHTRQINDNLVLSNSLFYIHGKGYWEIYKEDRELYEFGLSANPGDESDLVRQKWVDKHQTGWIPRLEYTGDRWNWTAGGNFNTFRSHHWGKVIWVQTPSGVIDPNHTDNDYNGKIWEGSLFGHTVYKATGKLNLIADLQFRHLGIEFEQNEAGAFTGQELNYYQISHNFLNPKIGASYHLTERTTAYTSLGLAQREPSDNEYWDLWQGPDDYAVDPLFAMSDTVWSNGEAVKVEWSEPMIKPESMIDWEIGVRHNTENLKGAVNFYLMELRNEIIYGGGVYDGYPLMGNADNTRHIGVEIEGSFVPVSKLQIYGNAAYSLNTFESDDILGYDISYNPVKVKGNIIPLFPDLMVNGGLSYDYSLEGRYRVKSSLRFRYIGKQYLESTNMEDAVIDPYYVADIGLNVLIPSHESVPEIRIQASVNNLLNTEYETSGYFYEGNYYYPGAERNYYFGLTVSL